jgi:hypothetical protein
MRNKDYACEVNVFCCEGLREQDRNVDAFVPKDDVLGIVLCTTGFTR